MTDEKPTELDIVYAIQIRRTLRAEFETIELYAHWKVADSRAAHYRESMPWSGVRVTPFAINK